MEKQVKNCVTAIVVGGKHYGTEGMTAETLGQMVREMNPGNAVKLIENYVKKYQLKPL